MLEFLSLIPAKIRICLIAAPVLLLLGTILVLTLHANSLNRRARTLAERLQAAQEQLIQRDGAIAAQERKIHDDRIRTRSANDIAQAVMRAKGTNADGPLAAVARDGLERLRGRQGAAAAGRPRQPAGASRP
jgi:hypothetical protein